MLSRWTQLLPTVGGDHSTRGVAVGATCKAVTFHAFSFCWLVVPIFMLRLACCSLMRCCVPAPMLVAMPESSLLLLLSHAHGLEAPDSG